MKNLTLIGLLAICGLAACKKDMAPSNEILTTSAFNAKFSVPMQAFSGSAGTSFTITGTKGIKVSFPANAFLDASGNPVTGAVKVTLKEVLSKRDIMLSGKMTESNGQILVSGGEFQVLATQNGQPLKLNLAAGVTAKVPTTLSSEPMQLFTYTGTTVSDSTWTLVQKGRVDINQNYYEFALPAFGWVNCDYFYSDPRPKTTITASPVYSGASPNIKLQTAYMIADDVNSVFVLPFAISINKHQSYLNAMPIGLKAKIAIISVDTSDKIYFGHGDLTVSAGLHKDVPVALATQGDIDNFLNTL